jgi:hypothetical protein
MNTEEEQLQSKVIHNLLNKIIAEQFPNLEKVLPIKLQEAFKIPNRLDQNRTSPPCITIKTINTENRERIINAVRGGKNNNI